MHGVGLRAAQDVEFGGCPCRRATRKLPPSVAEPNATRALCDGAMRAPSSFRDECPANDVVATLLRLQCGFDGTTDLDSVARLLVVKLVFIVVYNRTRCPEAASASAQCLRGRPAQLNVGLFLPVAWPGLAWPGLAWTSGRGTRLGRAIARFLLLEAAPSGSPARAHAVTIQRPRGRPRGGEARPGARLRRLRPGPVRRGLPLCTPPSCRSAEAHDHESHGPGTRQLRHTAPGVMPT